MLGKADVRLSLLDTSGNVETLWARFDVQSKGLQLSDVKVRGKLVHHNGSSSLECAIK